jgi:hypothetical protein
MSFAIRKTVGLFVISLAFFVAAGALVAIFVYGAMMVLWMHAPVFEVFILCLLFSIPLAAIVLMFRSIGLSLLRKSAN